MAKIDRSALSIIQTESRISVVELAERLGLSKSPCLKRLRRLEADGVVRGYRAELDAAKLDRNFLVLVQVKLTSTHTETLDRFNAAIAETAEVMACHLMAGGFDYLLKVRTRDMEEFRCFQSDTLSALPGVDQTTSFPVMAEVKDSNFLCL